MIKKILLLFILFFSFLNISFAYDTSDMKSFFITVNDSSTHLIFNGIDGKNYIIESINISSDNELLTFITSNDGTIYHTEGYNNYVGGLLIESDLSVYATNPGNITTDIIIVGYYVDEGANFSNSKINEYLEIIVVQLGDLLIFCKTYLDIIILILIFLSLKKWLFN